MDERLATIYDSAVVDLRAQVAEIDGLRGRTTQLLSTSAVAFSVLGGFATGSHRRIDAGGWVAVGATILVLSACVWLLLPTQWAGQSQDTEKLITGYVDANLSIDQLHRETAVYGRHAFVRNREKLSHRYTCLAGATVALAVELGGWLAQLLRV